MKTTIKVATVLVLGTLASCSSKPKSSCSIDPSVSMSVKPNKLERIEKTIENFDAIEMDGAFDVFLSSGTKSKVIIETTPSCEKEVKLEVKNGVLSISMISEIVGKNRPKINIFLTAKEYKKIVSNGACTIISKNMLVQNTMSIEANGASEFELDLQTKDINIEVHGASDINLKGSTNNFSIDSNGAATILAFGLIADSVVINTNGAGEAEVFANKSLKIENSGAGNVLYKGEAKDVVISNDGVGQVKKNVSR
jgi:Putative auto-transporter adhesin, head GIN domain